LFNDATLAPKGLAAAIKYLKSKKQVDATRIAVVGASIGGNLAAVGIANMGVKTAVCISGKISAVFNLAGKKFNLAGKKKLDLQSIYYISSNENRGARAAWAQELHKLTKEPRKITIIKSSDSHGVEIFKDEPNVEYQVLQWLGETL
jgi:dienelactone hydrolase